MHKIGSMGHTFGVRVDGTSSRRFLRFLSVTAFQAEGCGGALRAQIKKGGAADAAGCVEGLWKKVLKIDRPLAGGFLSLTGPLAPRVVDCRSAAMLIKSALRDWLSMSYSMISILVNGSLRSPPKGETAEWYMKYMTLCFSSPYFSFPLEGNASKRQRVYGAEHRFDTPSLS